MPDCFFVLPDDGFDMLLAPLRVAQHTIELYVFTLTNTAMIAALGAAVARGVTVRAVVEPRPGGDETEGAASRTALQQVGVQVRPAPPYYARLHAKSFVVDETQALVGSANFREEWQHTRDYGLLTTNPEIIRGLCTAFGADWAAQPDASPPPAPLVLSPVNSRAVLAGLMAEAQHTLLLQEEQITDPAMITMLAARSRAGVQVQIVTNPDQPRNAGPLADLRAQAPGVEVRYSTHLALHAKLLIADAQALLVGSVNLTPESLDARREMSVLVADPAIIARAVAVAQADFAAASPTLPAPQVHSLDEGAAHPNA